MVPHFHLSGIHGMVTALYVVAVFGSAHLAAASFPQNQLAKSWLALGF